MLRYPASSNSARSMKYFPTAHFFPSVQAFPSLEKLGWNSPTAAAVRLEQRKRLVDEESALLGACRFAKSSISQSTRRRDYSPEKVSCASKLTNKRFDGCCPEHREASLSDYGRRIYACFFRDLRCYGRFKSTHRWLPFFCL